MMNITEIMPLPGKYFGEILPQETMTKSGIHIAPTKHYIPTKVKILATGKPKVDKDGKHEKKVAKMNDIVYIKKYAGQKIYNHDDKKDYVFLQRDDIIGKVTNGTEEKT